jgi:predicted TIM-barrel fold metal-dependent hydrolase
VDGAAPGTTLATLQAHLLDPLDVGLAILSCDYGVESIRNPDAAAAIAAAINDWIVAEWLEPEPRLRAAIVVPSGQPAMAAAEIARVAAHPGFVAVYLPVRSAMPYGNRAWWPLIAAVAENELVAELHFGGSPGLPPTASGWPTSWLEDYVDMASAFQSQLTSLVAEGTFDRFPALRVALIESGFAWLPAFLWRFDKGWRGLRREVPWTKRPPSEYVRDHVKVALQPVDGPADPGQLSAVLDQLGSEDLLMFSSDYPHRHSAEGLEALPGLGDKIRSGNARRHYRL